MDVANIEKEEERAKKYSEKYFEPEMKRLFHRQNKVILNEFPEEGNILEIGCGLGNFLIDLPGNYDYTGIDSSEKCIEEGEKRFNRDFLRADAHELPFEDDQFDIVLLKSVIHHFRDPETALNEALRVLRTDGKLIIFEGSPKSIFRRLVLGTADILGIEHEASSFPFRSKEEIINFVESGGGKILKAEKVGGFSIPLAYNSMLKPGIDSLAFRIDSFKGIFHWQNLIVCTKD